MLFLRKIDRRKWFPPEDSSWLKTGDIPADPLGDLATRDNALSVWHIEDDESNLKRVVTGHAAKLGNIRNFEYSLFGEEILADLRLTWIQTKGDSFDDEANEKWHCEMIHLSAAKLVELTKALIPLSEGRKVVLELEVEQLILEAVAAKRIEIGRLKPEVRTRITRLL